MIKARQGVVVALITFMAGCLSNNSTRQLVPYRTVTANRLTSKLTISWDHSQRMSTSATVTDASDVDICDVCHLNWIETISVLNRSHYNCSNLCLHEQDGTCYQFWEEVSRDEERYLRLDTLKICFLIIYVTLFVIGLLGNLLVVLAVCRNNQMRTVTNMFLVNLAVSDFLVILVCLAPTLVEDLRDTWYMGLVLCKGIKFFQKLSVSVSVLTLTAISIERFRAICYVLKPRSGFCGVSIVCVVIWLLSAAIASPDIIQYQLLHYFPECIAHKYFYYVACNPPNGNAGRIVLLATCVVFFVIPLFVMSYTYTRIALRLWEEPKVNNMGNGLLIPSTNQTVQLTQRRRTAKMLIAIVIVFFLCYSPVHIMAILSTEGVLQYSKLDPQLHTFIYLLNHGLVYLGSAINPVIYNFMSEKFRREFRAAFDCCLGAANDKSRRRSGSTEITMSTRTTRSYRAYST